MVFSFNDAQDHIHCFLNLLIVIENQVVKLVDAHQLFARHGDPRKISGIQEVHWIAGEYNYLIKARVNSTDGLTALL